MSEKDAKNAFSIPPDKIAKYFPVTVDRSWPSVISRYALSALTQGAGVEADDANTLSAAQNLLEFRRKAVARLRTAGWEPMAEWINYVFTMNCPPVGVCTNIRGLKPCHRAKICPFCWCREYVAAPFSRFCNTLFDEVDLDRLIIPRRLVELYYQRTYLLGVEFEEIFHGAKMAQKKLILGCGPCATGAYVLTTIVPTKDRWLVRCRALVLLKDRDLEIKQWVRDEESLQSRLCNPAGGRQQLAASLGRVASYPSALLRSRPSVIAELLNAMPERFRLREFYGQLRGANF